MEQVPNAISTLDILRIGWPIVVALFALTFSAGGLLYMVKQTRKDLDHFKDDEYPQDKKEILQAIRDMKSSQEKSEEKLEKKLEKIASDTDRKLDKLFDLTNETKTFLAEIKGRLYPGVSDTQNPRGG